MAKRTIAEARAHLDGMTLSPAQRREHERFLAKHVNRAVAKIHMTQMASYTDLDAEVTQVKESLSAVEDELYGLEKDSRSRDVSAVDYRKRFSDLQERRERLMRRAMSLQTQTDKLVQVDEDPEAHLDSMYERYPTIKPDFPW